MANEKVRFPKESRESKNLLFELFVQRTIPERGSSGYSKFLHSAQGTLEQLRKFVFSFNCSVCDQPLFTKPFETQLDEFKMMKNIT